MHGRGRDTGNKILVAVAQDSMVEFPKNEDGKARNQCQGPLIPCACHRGSVSGGKMGGVTTGISKIEFVSSSMGVGSMRSPQPG